jgi:hypothetical protein
LIIDCILLKHIKIQAEAPKGTHQPIPYQEYLKPRAKKISTEWELMATPLIQSLEARKKECERELEHAASHYNKVHQQIDDNCTALVQQIELVRKQLKDTLTQQQSKDMEAMLKYQQTIIEKTESLKNESLLVPIQNGSSFTASEWKNVTKIQDRLEDTLKR